MIFNFLFFTVKIERNAVSPELRLAEMKRNQFLKEREEAQAMEAAMLPEFISRM
ncbi:hypothetical protein [Brevibacillus sp. H7]|jgi:hypothetical protein|uniref:hypothetical protein n=1 Tax=Brevibacillus sp. H7 TaxID=3349138 RepID=UPI0038135615